MKLNFLLLIPCVALTTLSLNAMDNRYLAKKSTKRCDLRHDNFDYVQVSLTGPKTLPSIKKVSNKHSS